MAFGQVFIRKTWTVVPSQFESFLEKKQKFPKSHDNYL